ncbi:MAG: hypothetical protein CSB24_06895 [Deltaproteobacteria bacterium]|nr:MAG: hypothetical protein CSB24_06895 [Deltaproteobacteria bacterium]
MRPVIYLFILVFLAGCARIPEPVDYYYSVQQKMQAAYHWDVLAADLAHQINKQLIRNDFIDKPVFVKQTCGYKSVPCKENEASLFNKSFHDLLITELVDMGVPTVSEPDGNCLYINYKAQLVYHLEERIRTFRPGNITALTTGIVVLRNAPAALLAIAIGGIVDLANASYVRSGHYEVIVTTSIEDHGAYIFRQSDIYYINDKDSWHYMEGVEAANIEMTKRYFSRGSSAGKPPQDPPEKPKETAPKIIEIPAFEHVSTDI